jgi:hypothetical protein
MNQVYFVKPIGMDGPIKIGFTSLIRERIAALNAWSPLELELVAVIDGARELEQRFHAKFAASRQHGEWFTWSPELAAVVANVQAGAFDTDVLPQPVRLPRKPSNHDNRGVVDDPQLLSDVLTFCAGYGIKHSMFGRAAGGDPALVSNMKQGRKPRRRLNARIRHYMASYAPLHRLTQSGTAA